MIVTPVLLLVWMWDWLLILALCISIQLEHMGTVEKEKENCVSIRRWPKCILQFICILELIFHDRLSQPIFASFRTCDLAVSVP